MFKPFGNLAAKVLVPVLVVALAFGIGFLFGRSNNAARVAWLEDELERQREITTFMSTAQLKRQNEVIELQKQVTAYELEIANGTTGACPSDPVYDQRLRNILETINQRAIIR